MNQYVSCLEDFLRFAMYKPIVTLTFLFNIKSSSGERQQHSALYQMRTEMNLTLKQLCFCLEDFLHFVMYKPPVCRSSEQTPQAYTMHEITRSSSIVG